MTFGLTPDFEVERESITFGKSKPQTIQPRGITMEDLGAIIAGRLSEVEMVYGLFSAAKASVYSRSSLDGFVMTMIAKTPDLAAEVISRACDDPDNRMAYRKIPVGAQAATLLAITRLTFEEAGGLGNLVASLTSLLDEALPADARARMETLIAQSQGAAPTVQ